MIDNLSKWRHFLKITTRVEVIITITLENCTNIGESLFTIFASLAWAIRFLMELQINQFWILKVHSMINSTSECEPGLLNTFCATRVKKTQNFTKNVWAHQCFCHFADFAVFERQFLPEYYTQREKTLNFTSSLAAWSQFISNKFPSLGKALCKWAKM